jgi:asparagine synthase (glutamine-hydrolysing)
MCGIFGWIVPRAQAQEVERLRTLTDMLAHRGPDGSGCWLDLTADGSHQIAFGHRRLAIIDLSEAGSQPMWAPNRSSVITYNGEIYNYIELRTELEKKGYLFRTDSDTEVLLNAYECWGVDCLTRLRGMFAFALFDITRQQLFFARDPFGKKPLYLHRHQGRIVFSSEIEPLLCFPGIEKQFDSAALPAFLLNREAHAGPLCSLEGWGLAREAVFRSTTQDPCT